VICREPTGGKESGIKKSKKRAHEDVQVEGELFFICSFLPLLCYAFCASSRLCTLPCPPHNTFSAIGLLWLLPNTYIMQPVLPACYSSSTSLKL
jgi:hypothetical protein